jgi:hypothetical protein
MSQVGKERKMNELMNETSLPCSRQLVVGLYPQPNEYIQQRHTLFLESIFLILSSYAYVDLTSVHIPLRTKYLLCYFGDCKTYCSKYAGICRNTIPERLSFLISYRYLSIYTISIYIFQFFWRYIIVSLLRSIPALLNFHFERWYNLLLSWMPNNHMQYILYSLQ